MKIIAFYLPQYYEFPENNEWWGKGFTEWTNVKKSKPLFKGHYQPTVPLNNNFYSLEKIETIKWQIELAKKYNIYGFCFYHYWFGNDRKLMEKPVEMYLEHKSLDLPFCLCWANHNWTRTWTGGEHEILMEMEYGDEQEWEKHFKYLLPYFKDKRYITIDEKPVFIIYQPQLIQCFDNMKKKFNDLAKEAGLSGLCFISQSLPPKNSYGENLLDYCIQYEPNYSRFSVDWNIPSLVKIGLTSVSFLIDMFLYRIKLKIKTLSKNKFCKIIFYDYDATWNYILKRKVNSKKLIAGAFVRCDVSPRRQDRALIYKNSNPEKFEKYLKQLIKKVRTEYTKPIIFISAWNEWGEGMYLEPDEKYGYKYLEAVRNSQI